jgi:hypothetical protein
MLDEKVGKILKYVFIQFTQAKLQKWIKWPNFFGKGK